MTEQLVSDRNAVFDAKYDKNDKNENVRICESSALTPWPLSRTCLRHWERGEALTPTLSRTLAALAGRGSDAKNDVPTYDSTK